MTNKKRMAVTLGLVAVGLATAGGVRAFQQSNQWHDDPSQGQHCGGGDLWFNGSARDWNLACVHCHINDMSQQGNLTVQVSGFDPGNKYVAGKTYTITMTMVSVAPGGELAAGDSKNRNGFTGTIEDANGNTAGSFLGNGQSACMPPTTNPDAFFAPPQTTIAFGDCHAIASLGHVGLTSWSFKWTAPAGASGPLTFYYGVVDGNANLKSLGDDVKMGKVLLTP